MIDLAAAELEEIRRIKADLIQIIGVTLEALDALLRARYPGKVESQLNLVERRLWLKELRAYQRGQALPQGVLQPTLPFTGGVNESFNQK